MPPLWLLYLLSIFTLALFVVFVGLAMMPMCVLSVEQRHAVALPLKVSILVVFVLATVPTVCSFPVYGEYDDYLFGSFLPPLLWAHVGGLIACWIVIAVTVARAGNASMRRLRLGRGLIAKLTVLSFVIWACILNGHLFLVRSSLDRIPPIQWDSNVDRHDAAMFTKGIKEFKQNKEHWHTSPR